MNQSFGTNETTEITEIIDKAREEFIAKLLHPYVISDNIPLIIKLQREQMPDKPPQLVRQKAFG